MKKNVRKLLAVVMSVTTCVFAVMGSGCSSVSDWVKDKYDQLTCEHLTEKFIPAVAPTCTEKGSTEGIECADCGKVLTEPSEVAALGHTLEHYEALEATCMQTGLTEGEYCTVCEEWIVEQDTVKRTGHKVVTVKGKRPTCTETGLTDGQACDHCGVVYVAQKEIPMIEHYYSNGVCLNCGAFDFSNYQIDGKYVEVDAVEGDTLSGNVFRFYFEGGVTSGEFPWSGNGFFLSSDDSIGFYVESPSSTSSKDLLFFVGMSVSDIPDSLRPVISGLYTYCTATYVDVYFAPNFFVEYYYPPVSGTAQLKTFTMDESVTIKSLCGHVKRLVLNA